MSTLSSTAEQIPSHFLNCFYIDGSWVYPSASSSKRALVSPVTEHAWIDVPLAGPEDVDHAVAAARRAFDCGSWPSLSGSERASCIRRLTQELEARSEFLAELSTAQVAAPISFARSLVPVGISRFRHFSALAASYRFEDRRPTPRGHARVRRDPVGVAALIVPWNATFPILSQKLAAALAAGCTVVVKSPPESPFDALVIAECAHAAGLPPGVVNVITADREQSEQLVASADVDKISFTGSVAVGQRIAAVASARMAHLTLELGGKSAAILAEDVDLPDALRTLVPFTMPFAGQICFAQTRILAPLARYEEVVGAYAAAMAAIKVGDPWAPDTRMGPVLNARQYGRVLDCMELGVKQGARVFLGGRPSAGFSKGHYIDPTIFADVTADMAIAREEVFGPVVAVLPYRDIDEAVALANDTDYGLSGSVFTRNAEQGYRIARRIRTGQVGVNAVELAPNVPFGGYKLSGIGREGGVEGLEAFLQTQAVFMPSALDAVDGEGGF
jgi:acyl-CoA reductase-like NAD-dependent aldehyde dehydrogenase